MRRRTLQLALSVLLLVLSATAVAETRDRNGWEGDDYQGLALEWSIASQEGLDIEGRRLVHGLFLNVGGRVVLWAQSGTSLSGEISSIALGNHFGLDISTSGLNTPTGWLWIAGVDLAARNVLGLRTSQSTIRLSSVTDVLWPEVGYAARGDEHGLSLGWHFRADVLVTAGTFLSGRLGANLLYFGDEPMPLANVAVGFGLR